MKILGIIAVIICIILFVGLAVTGFYVIWDKAAEKKIYKTKKKQKVVYDDYCKWS